MPSVDAVADLGMGKVGSNDHPIHPSSVHLPIAFLLASSGLNVVNYVARGTPKLVGSVAGLLSMNSSTLLQQAGTFAHVSNIAGIVTSLPALNTGIFEFYGIYKKRGLDLSDPVVKTTMIHAGLNDLAAVGAIYNWWTQRGAAGFAPTRTNAVVSGLILGGVVFSAYLGGTLVYKHGVGVQRMGEGKDIKEEGISRKTGMSKAEVSRKEL